MLRRARTTKQLAQRIDLQYFTRPHALRRWRFWLSIAVPGIALLWFAVQRVEGGKKTYSSGPLAQAHTVFTQQCSLCHTQKAGGFFEHASDHACLTCHDVPAHHANQAFNPACGSCHVEHKGTLRLAATADAACTQCHADLQTREGRPHFATSIHSFARHPEFSALAGDKVDTGRIRLNHYLHMQAGLAGPNGTRVQLDCGDCHRGNVNMSNAYEAWPYPGTQTPAAISATPSPFLGKAHFTSPPYMAPPEFADNCAGCHTLQFDRRFGNEEVPHDRPEVVHAFLLKRFAEYMATHPASLHEVEPPNREIPERVRPLRVAHTEKEWIDFRVDDAEWLLWVKTCKQCHAIQVSASSLPEIAKADFTKRWFAHAAFDHTAHRMMTCTSCHTRAPESHSASDVLIPGVQTCQKCHREPSQEAAEGRCFECHQYHDWSKAQRTKGRFTIPELIGSARGDTRPAGSK